MAETIATLMDPIKAAPHTGLIPRENRVLRLWGKVCTLQGYSGTDYRTNLPLLVADASALVKGEPESIREAISARTWCRIAAIQGSNATTLAELNTLINNAKNLAGLDDATLDGIEKYLDASIAISSAFNVT